MAGWNQTEISEQTLFNYEPTIPYFVEECKDLLNTLNIKPSNKNGLKLAYAYEVLLPEVKL